MKSQKFIPLICATLLSFLWTGCESIGTPAKLGRLDSPTYPNAPFGVTVIPNLPPVEDPGIRYTSREVRKGTFKAVGIWPTMEDGVFAPFPIEYLREHEALIIEALKILLGPDYVDAANDCDDSAEILQRLAAWVFAASGIEAMPLVAVVEVGQRKAFAFVAATETGRHALTGIKTTDGIYILESQSPRDGRWIFTPLRDYPNFEFIDTVTF